MIYFWGSEMYHIVPLSHHQTCHLFVQTVYHFRHLILSAGPAMTGAMWDICVCGLSNAVSVSTCNIRRVMSIFHPDSDNFYGDIAQVKVATRKNCVAVDTMRLRQLAQQVILFPLNYVA